jgi:hypothetical protein
MKGKKDHGPSRIRKDVNYFINGEDVIFDFNGMDFTFEKFYLLVNDSGMYLSVKDEAPMNLINLLETVVDKVGVNRKDVLDADKVDIFLKLDDNLFKEMKEEVLNRENAKDIFRILYKDHELLKVLNAYSLEGYSTYQRNIKVYARGKLIDAIKRRSK